MHDMPQTWTLFADLTTQDNLPLFQKLDNKIVRFIAYM